MGIDLTESIERMEALEQHFGIRLSGLFVELDDDGDLAVNGEVYARSGQTIDQNIKIVAAAYDARGRVIGQNETIILSDEFFGFETFRYYVMRLSHDVARVRIYPKAL
jgi:hypothetical protein